MRAGAEGGRFLKMQEGFGAQVVNPGSRAEAEPQEGKTVSASLLNLGPRAILPPCGPGKRPLVPPSSLRGTYLAPFDTCCSQCPEVQVSRWTTQPGTGGRRMSGANVYVSPLNSYIKALTSSVAVLGGGTSEEVIMVK